MSGDANNILLLLLIKYATTLNAFHTFEIMKKDERREKRSEEIDTMKTDTHKQFCTNVTTKGKQNDISMTSVETNLEEKQLKQDHFSFLPFTNRINDEWFQISVKYHFLNRVQISGRTNLPHERTSLHKKTAKELSYHPMGWKKWLDGPPQLQNFCKNVFGFGPVFLIYKIRVPNCLRQSIFGINMD